VVRYLSWKVAPCSVFSSSLTTSSRHGPLQDLSVFQTYVHWR
jgi:hypothetical protein